MSGYLDVLETWLQRRLHASQLGVLQSSRAGAARPTLPRPLVAVVAGLLAAACGSSEATAPLSNTPAFSIAITGDVSSSFNGIPASLKAPSGYGESVNSEPLQTTSVVLVTFAGSDAGRTSINIGLIGPIQPGTYNVRITGSSPLGSRPEFYGSIAQTDFDGKHSFTATSGTVTLTSAGTTLRGTFSLHYGRVTVLPPTPTPGTSYPVTSANVDATGSFVVAAPTTTVP